MHARPLIDQRIRSAIGLARALAWTAAVRWHADPDDLESEACVALWHAAVGYDPDSGATWATYAHAWITRTIQSRLAAQPVEHVAAPVRWKRDVLRVRKAIAALRARGLRHPSAEHIAAEAQVSLETCQRVLALPAVKAAQRLVERAPADYPPHPSGEPELEPLFGCTSFTPLNLCPHGFGGIHDGLPLVCMVCHASGMDAHPALRRNPATDPAPEPKPAPAAPARKKRETRRERRRREYQHAVSA